MNAIRSACVLSLAFAVLCIASPVRAQSAEPAADAAPATAAAPAGAPEVARIVLCRDVQEREPVDAGTSFPADVDKLVCFTLVENGEGKTVYHRWYVGDRMVLELPIAVGASHWRCWSRKTIDPSWSGAARVDIATEAGDVIASQDFTLGAAPAAAAQ